MAANPTRLAKLQLFMMLLDRAVKNRKMSELQGHKAGSSIFCSLSIPSIPMRSREAPRHRQSPLCGLDKLFAKPRCCCYIVICKGVLLSTK